MTARQTRITLATYTSNVCFLISDCEIALMFVFKNISSSFQVYGNCVKVKIEKTRILSDCEFAFTPFPNYHSHVGRL
jgi:hypothetical protein